MNSRNLLLIKKIFRVAVFSLITSACGKIVGDRNYTLAEGSIISGTLFLLSNNALLEKGTTVDGDIKGDIVLITGNLQLDRSADVSGEVHVMSGNVSR